MDGQKKIEIGDTVRIVTKWGTSRFQWLHTRLGRKIMDGDSIMETCQPSGIAMHRGSPENRNVGCIKNLEEKLWMETCQLSGIALHSLQWFLEAKSKRNKKISKKELRVRF